MVVPVCFMVVAWTYAVAVNFIPAYRNPADKIGAARIGLDSPTVEETTGDRTAESDLERNTEVSNEIMK